MCTMLKGSLLLLLLYDNDISMFLVKKRRMKKKKKKSQGIKTQLWVTTEEREKKRGATKAKDFHSQNVGSHTLHRLSLGTTRFHES